MTKKELIEQLEKYPDDMEVTIYGFNDYGNSADEIDELEVVYVEEMDHWGNRSFTWGENNDLKPVILLS